MFRKWIPVMVLMFTASRGGSVLAAKRGSEEALVKSPATVSANVGDLLENTRKKHNVPAMGAVIVFEDGSTVTAVAGRREAGRSTPVEMDDKWHLGSNTKAFTATMLARLVEQKRLSWTTTIGEVLTNKVTVHPELLGVTVQQLMSHSSGLPRDFSFEGAWVEARRGVAPLREQRLALAKEVLIHAPLHKPGTKRLYSNAGVLVAGVIASEATNQDWEELLREEVLDPLALRTAGFGAPGTPGRIDQPRGHRKGWFLLKPVRPGPLADNPAALGPAGTLNMSMADYGKFLRLHLLPDTIGHGYLTAESFELLHSDSDSPGFALGWGVVKGDNGEVILTHAGSNTLWFHLVWLSHKRGLAIAVAANRGAPKGEQACNSALQRIGRMIGSGRNTQ